MRYKNIIIVALLLIIIAVLWIININKLQKGNELFDNAGNIRIGEDECFSLTDNEYLVDLKSKDTSITNYINKNYWYLYTRESDQVLNNIIKGKNDFFIWLSFATPGEFARKQNADTTIKIIEYKDFIFNKRRFNAFFMQRENIYINRTLFVSSDRNLIVIDNPGFDSLNIFNLYKDTTYIAQRLCNN